MLRPRLSLARARVLARILRSHRTHHGPRSRAGFTLVEMLSALMVLGLLTALVATGVARANDIYRAEQFASQSQVLSDSIYNAISTPIRFMRTDADGNYVVSLNGEKIKVSAGTDGRLLASRDGRLYFVGASTEGGSVERQVLIDSAYGTCDVSLEELGLSADDVKVKISVTDASAPERSREYEYHLDPLGADYTAGAVA